MPSVTISSQQLYLNCQKVHDSEILPQFSTPRAAQAAEYFKCVLLLDPAEECMLLKPS